MVECPECGESYQKIGLHWYGSPSHRPELTQRQIEVTTGLLMGDGWININSKNMFLCADMISPNYLEYLDNLFGIISNGVRLKDTAYESAEKARKSGFRPDAKEENYSNKYSWRTKAHPKFNEFREWYSTGEKVWPEDIKLTPTVLKHWYVGDGNYDNHESCERIKIAMSNEIENTEKVSNYFQSSGLPKPTNFTEFDNGFGKSCVAQWTTEDSHKLWDYMGKPLPDFEYKWPEECC